MEELVGELERHAPDVTIGDDDLKLDEDNAAHLVAALQQVPRVTSATFRNVAFEGLSDVVRDIMQCVPSVTAMELFKCDMDVRRVAVGLRGNAPQMLVVFLL